MNTSMHCWRFFRAGGFDQVCIDTADDLLALKTLDQKLWMALACPTTGIEFDERTLALIDADQDGILRAPELLAAIAWAAARLSDSAVLVGGLPGVPLAALCTADDEVKVLAEAAQSLLAALGKMGSDLITVEDASLGEAQFKRLPNNGDGVIAAEDCGNDMLAAALADIVTTSGGVPDCRGGQGVNRALLEEFFDQAHALKMWRDNAPAATSADAHIAFAAVATKVDDFFVRVQLAAFDERAAAAMNSSDECLLAIGMQDLAVDNSDIAALPLAHVSANADLPLTEGVNPAWSDAIAALHGAAITSLLGQRNTLSAADWQLLKDKLAAHAAWLAAKPETSLEILGPERIEELLDEGFSTALFALISADEAHAPQAAAIASVERLARYVRDLHPLSNNFVAFRNFYTRQGKATFQVGTLYIDGRSAELVVAVSDAAKHVSMAGLSRIFLVYCDCTRKDADGVVHKQSIAAALTAGDADQLIVGRNGVFYDRKGNDWIASITRISEQSISLRQAFWSPYKRLARMIGEQLQKIAASKATAVDGQIAAAANSTGKPLEAAPKTPPTPFDVGKFAGIFAAVGLAVGAIGTALAALLTGLLGLPGWQVPLALLGLMLVVSGPAVILAWFKLRNRSLGPLLDANGWAINARTAINIPFGTSLTQLAKLPPGAERSLKDPYEEKRRPWAWYLSLIVIAAIVCWWLLLQRGRGF